MYQVLDCKKPADCHHHNVDASWDKSTFDTEQEAQEYAAKWLGPHADNCHLPKGISLFPLPLDTPFDYDDYGDTIEIRNLKYKRTCSWCGKEFHTADIDHDHCSYECYQEEEKDYENHMDDEWASMNIPMRKVTPEEIQKVCQAMWPIRKALNLTLDELCNRLDISKPTLIKIEKGNAPRLYQVQAILVALTIWSEKNDVAQTVLNHYKVNEFLEKSYQIL